MKRLLMTSLIVAAFGLSVAQAVEPAAQAPAADTAVQEPAQGQAKKPPSDDAFCLRHTGTRIAGRTDSRRQRMCSNGAIGRAYTRDDLDRTGHINTAEALRALDPSIH